MSIIIRKTCRKVENLGQVLRNRKIKSFQASSVCFSGAKPFIMMDIEDIYTLILDEGLSQRALSMLSERELRMES